MYLITKWMTHLFFPIFYNVDIKKEEGLSHHGPAIILPKHQYWTDIPLVMLSFRSTLHFVAKKELFRSPWIRSYLLLSGAIPINREQSLRTLESFRYLFSWLQADEEIVIFPEGTRVPGAVGAGKARLIKSILKFQSKLNKQIAFIPVGIRYGERLGWRRHVEVRIGHPLFADGKSDASSLTHRVLEEIRRLCCFPSLEG